MIDRVERDLDPDWQPGDEVVVLVGPLKSFTGLVVAFDVERRALTVDVRIHGKITPVELPDWLVAARSS